MHARTPEVFMGNIHAQVAALARAQHGAFSLQQVRALGVTRDVVYHRVNGGFWERVHGGVYRLAGAPLTWESRALAACLTHDGGIASHLTAAHLWGLDDFGPVGLIDVTVSRHKRPRSQQGIRYHETLAYDLAGLTARRGIPVTGPARTVLDVCGVTDELRSLGALDEVRRRRLAHWPELLECLILHARRGRNGTVRFRHVVTKRYGKTVPQGTFSRLFERLLEDAGVDTPVHEFRVVCDGHVYFIDQAYPDLLIAIELLGRIGHDYEAAYERDPVRRFRL